MRDVVEELRVGEFIRTGDFLVVGDRFAPSLQNGLPVRVEVSGQDSQRGNRVRRGRGGEIRMHA